jgi:lactate permease
VLNLRGIFGTDTDWTHQVLYVPSLIPFVLIAIVSWRVLAAPAGTARTVWRESAARMRQPVLALLGALVFVRLLMVGGEESSVMLIGHSLAAATGGWWTYLAAYLGALGAFFAGSCTISNLTFGPIQDSIATRMGLERTTILALQSVGGTAMSAMESLDRLSHGGRYLTATITPLTSSSMSVKRDDRSLLPSERAGASHLFADCKKHVL